MDLSEARPFLDPDFGRRVLAGWFSQKFGLAIAPKDLEGQPRPEVVRRLEAEARAHYARKEGEFPVRVAMTRFFIEGGPGHPARYDREALVEWLQERFGYALDIDEIRPLRKQEIQDKVMGIAHANYRGAALTTMLDAKLEAAFGPEVSNGKPIPEPNTRRSTSWPAGLGRNSASRPPGTSWPSWAARTRGSS